MTDRLDNEIPDGTPVQVWLLGEPWAIARLDGELVAVPDRCPHMA